MQEFTINKNPPLSTEEIWMEFSHALRFFIKSRLRNDDIVDDLIQEIFFKIHANIDSLKDNSKLRSWIYQIARNAITDFFREEKKRRVIIDELKVADNFSFDNTANEILFFCMNHFMSLLPDKYRDAIIFTEIEGHSQIELAKRDGISVSAAKSRVQRGRARLKELILEYTHVSSGVTGVNIESMTENCPFCRTKKI